MELINIGFLLDNLSYLHLALYLFFVCLHFFSEPIRWAIYMPSIKENRFFLSCKIFFFTAFISYLFPLKIGLPLRVILLKNKVGLNMPEISVFLLLDSLIYYSLWGMSAVLITLMITLIPSVFIYSFSIQVFLFIPIIVIILFLLHFIIRRKNKKKDYEDNSKRASLLIINIKYWFSQIIKTYKQIKPKILAMACLIGCIDIASHIFRHWALLNTLGYDLPWLYFSVVTCLSIFSGLISMMPMGLGGYDAIIVLLLTQAGIPFKVAIAVPILNRVGNITVSILLGIWSGWGLQMNPFDLTWIKKCVGQRKDLIN